MSHDILCIVLAVANNMPEFVGMNVADAR